MSVQSYLETLRAKPETHRKRIAFWSAFGVTVVIFAFWLGSFSVAGSSAKGAVASAVNQAGSPAQSLVASVGSFFVDIKDIFFGPKKITYSTIEVSPGNVK